MMRSMHMITQTNHGAPYNIRNINPHLFCCWSSAAAQYASVGSYDGYYSLWAITTSRACGQRSLQTRARHDSLRSRPFAPW